MRLSIWLGGHPSYQRLIQFSDRDLRGRVEREVAKHLERCSRCRREIQIIRDADEALRQVPVPRMAGDLFERVLTRRASSVIPLLPLGPPTGPRSRRPVVAATGLIVVLVAAIGLVTAGRAGADASVLEIRSIEGSGLVSVRFRPSSLLANEDSVRVRAWAWEGRYDRISQPRLFTAPLRRQGGEFRGPLRLDLRYDFAWVAVESWDGSRVDWNGGGFSPLNRDADGRRSASSYAGELLALQDFANRGFPLWAELQSVANEALGAFPDSPMLSSVKAAYDFRVTTTERARDSVRNLYERRLRELSIAPGRSSADLVDLLNLALTLENEPEQRRLLDLLRRLAPDHPRIHERRVVDLLNDLRGDPAIIPALEREWEIAGPANQFLVRSGFTAVRRFDDADAVLRWVDRSFVWNESNRDGLLIVAARLEATRDWAIERLPPQIRLRRHAFDSARPIYETRESFRVDSRRQAARLEMALGNALLDRGQRGEAIESLDRALELTWDLETAERLIAALGGDVQEHEATSGSSRPGRHREATDRVAELRALVAADPLSGFEQAPSAAVAAAREVLRDRLTVGARSGFLERESIRLGAPEQEPRALDPGPTTVLAAWHALPPRAELAVLEGLSSRLEEENIELLLVGSEEHFQELAARSSHLQARAFYEIDGSATETLGGWHAYEYVVISNGRYWVVYDPQDAVRLALLVSGD